VGRKKKARGKLFEGLRGKPIRITRHLVKPQHLVARLTRKRPPRGKAADVYELTSFLKERAPLVYVFIVEELKKGTGAQNPQLQRIIAEWNRDVAPYKRPTARELTAYVMERAMGGAWEAWGLKRPQSDTFYRRYIHGHPGAIRDFRRALRQPRPWHRHHVGHEIKWFLGRPGEAARKYNLLKPRSSYATIVSIVEED